MMCFSITTSDLNSGKYDNYIFIGGILLAFLISLVSSYNDIQRIKSEIPKLHADIKSVKKMKTNLVDKASVFITYQDMGKVEYAYDINSSTNQKDVEIKINDEKSILDVSGIFPLIGSLPSNSFLSSYPIFSSNGYMIVDEHFQTSVKGIYGVGDVVDKELRQVVTACSDGAIAAQYIATHKN